LSSAALIDPHQPRWSQTGKEAGSADAIVYRGEACGQRIVGTTDEGVEVSIPHCPFINMLDPDGNVCAVVISTNRDLVQADQKYKHVTVTVRLRKGWVIWDHDPTVHFGMTADQWTERRDALKAERLAKAQKKSARFRAMTNDKMQDLLSSVADNQKLLARVVAKLEAGDLAGAEKLAKQAGKKGAGE
jgi:hypothetical protein